MNEPLYVYYENCEVGVLRPDDNRRLSFCYAEPWLEHPDQHFPISQSMPLRSEPYTSVAHAYFTNLLPEGGLRDLICSRLKISPENDYELLKRIGGDCAGALRILKEDDDISLEDQHYEPISELTSVETIVGGMLLKHTDVRLSLAGAQYKLPVYLDQGKLYLPRKHAPSSHILKFSNRNYRRLSEVECLVTSLAREIGLDVVELSLWPYGHQQMASISLRYDRVKEGGRLLRLHQEDFCQVQGIPASMKYQNEGGPSLADCIEIIRTYSDDVVADTRKLIQWMAFNVLVGNCDFHAKNLSFLYRDGQTRLAPIYDLVATTHYKQVSIKMAMHIGGQEIIHDVGKTHWTAQAQAMGISPKMLTTLVSDLSEQIQTHIEPTFAKIDPISASFRQNLSRLIIKQCKRTQRLLSQ